MPIKFDLKHLEFMEFIKMDLKLLEFIELSLKLPEFMRLISQMLKPKKNLIARIIILTGLFLMEVLAQVMLELLSKF